MGLYAIGDLHLGLSVDKPMDVFGNVWKNHTEKIREGFSRLSADDTVMLCGDLSWGMTLDEALEDFRFLDALPGRKIIVKGNHDYWWNTASKMNAFFAAHGLRTLHILHNNSYTYGSYGLCGTRGWFRDEETADAAHNQKVLNREVLRLEQSLRSAGDAQLLCFLHYPPLQHGYECPQILETLQRYNVHRCFYGHLHGKGHYSAIEGEQYGIDFSLISADYLAFKPKKICGEEEMAIAFSAAL